MKANHNRKPNAPAVPLVVVNISKSKNESKSQRLTSHIPAYSVVVNISKSKNESKSQHENERGCSNIVVVNISKSKNESKSQHWWSGSSPCICCGKYQ